MTIFFLKEISPLAASCILAELPDFSVVLWNDVIVLLQFSKPNQ